MLPAAAGRRVVMGRTSVLESGDGPQARPRFWLLPTFGRGEERTVLGFAPSFLALGLVVAPGAALAQCNASPTPPPAPPIQQNYANQSFGTAFPSTPYYRLVTIGINGCDGAPNGGFDTDGNPGLP